MADANRFGPFDRAVDVLVARPRTAWTIAVVRILFGLVLLGWTITLMLDASTWLADDGLVPPEFASTEGWRWFDLDSTGAAWVAVVALALAAVAITVGWRPTPWLILAFLLLVALQRRDPVILNSGDFLVRNFALLLAFVPTGAALSVDRRLRHGPGSLWTAPMVAPWGLRLIQLQMMVVYFFAFWSKSGETWRNGTAVSTALRLEDIRRLTPPSWMIDNIAVVAALTWGALAIELALAMLLWAKPLRPFLIVLGLTLHLFIDAFMLVGFFGLAMAVGLLSFLDADWIDRKVAGRRRTRAGPEVVADSAPADEVAGGEPEPADAENEPAHAENEPASAGVP